MGLNPSYQVGRTTNHIGQKQVRATRTPCLHPAVLLICLNRSPLSAMSRCYETIWRFLQMGVYTKLDGLIDNPIKMDALGVPPFQETSI